jgi:pimeloyl-ACP methyl ester carboxylesterase
MVPTAFGDTHVIVSGEPGAAPVVLLHATGTSATGWLKNVGPLSQHHRVFAVDIMGEAGRSRQHALLRDRHDCATWVASLLDQLGLEQASFVGWSFGGWATLAFLMAEPDRVSKCVLLAPYASLAPYKLPVLLFLKLAPYLPTGPPGRLALRMMAPGVSASMSASPNSSSSGAATSRPQIPRPACSRSRTATKNSVPYRPPSYCW